MTTTPIIPDDKTLFHRLQTGDREAFDLFYHRHFNSLYKAAFIRLQNAELCKDIIQEVFTDCWQRRHQIDNNNPVAYLHTAVRFQVFKQAARSSKQSFYEPFEAMGNITPSATDNLQYKELLQLIELWTETLPEKRRAIFQLHYKQNLSTRQIAEQLQLSQKTVQNQLGIAFNDLRSRLPELLLALLFSSDLRL